MSIFKLAGSLIQSNSANKAADKQAAAAKSALNMQKQMFDQQRADQEPWRQAGVTALSGLGNADFQRDFSMADFQQDPGYDFRMQEGQKALERSAAARGGLNSGGTLKALSRYGQDYASGEYGKAYDRFNADRDRRFGRLSNLAGMGQGATNQMGQASQNFANQYGDIKVGGANQQAEASIAQGNIWGGALSDLSKDAMSAGTMGMGGGGSWMDQWMSKQGGR